MNGPSQVIKYTPPPLVGRRTIKAADFKSVGVEMSDQVWSPANHWMVDASNWNVAAIEMVRGQAGFVLLVNDPSPPEE